MDLMVNPVITDFQQDVNGDIKMLKIGANKEDAYANIQGQVTGSVENNKTATIDVSTYTQAVEITPTSGKTSMKKTTVTLSNIPSGSGTLRCWKSEIPHYIYTFSETVSVGDKVISSDFEFSELQTLYTIASVSDEGVTLEELTASEIFARDTEGDISLT